jgi:hypothetical protein
LAGSSDAAGDFGRILSELGFFGKVFWGGSGRLGGVGPICKSDRDYSSGLWLVPFPLENATAFQPLDFKGERKWLR